MAASEHRLVRARWLILGLFFGVCVWLFPGLREIEHDDDVLAFLPPDHVDVQAFDVVASRFGMLELVLVGLRTESGDLFDPDQIDRMRLLSERLAELAGVKMVLSFVDLPDPKVTEDGLEVAALVPPELRDADAIGRRVLANADAVGNLIAPDGKSAALLVYLLHERGNDRVQRREQILADIRRTVADTWTEESHFGGAPFAEYQAAQSSRHDIRRLSPFVIAVLAVASAALLGSITAAVLNLVLAGLGIALILGAHGRFGEPLTIVSSTLPVMMVAFGGAFGVHMLAGYQRQRGTARQRASAAVRELWSPIVLSGVTTAVSFFALLVMPQVPMQRFGLIAGLGVLLLLALALVVLPAVLSILPERFLPSRPPPTVPFSVRPPLFILVAIAMAGAAVGSRLRANPDTNDVFDPESEFRQTNAFFEDHFGGSTFIQIALEGDLAEPVVLRLVRDIADTIRGVRGVVDVRSLVEPVAVLTEALGGRRGIPETPARASRVLTYLADHPAMAQLMTADRQAALVHVKLAPLTGDEQVRVTNEVRSIVGRFIEGPSLRVGDVSVPEVAASRREAVRARLSYLLGREISDTTLEALESAGGNDPGLLEVVTALRDRALDSEDSPVEGVPRVEIESIDPRTLLEPRNTALESLLRDRLPTLAASDPEGVRFVAEHLGPWIDDAISKWKVDRRCSLLVSAQGQGNAAAGESPAERNSCARLAGTLSELEDPEWRMFTGVNAVPARELPVRAFVTGQPVIGQAFASSVTENLRDATMVSIAALTVVLLLARQIVALAPALWTLGFTAGVLVVLGQPISIGTSMVFCIALGAGVDFGIHLCTRARRNGGPDPAVQAVGELGGVVLVSGIQLALAFLVLLASDMPPLREFGLGLAVGLVGAALAAVWLIPALMRVRRATL